MPTFKFSLLERKHITAKTNYQLTALGKTKAEEFRVSGPKGDVMVILEDSGPCTVSEIANNAKVSPEKVKHIIRSLEKDGWVRPVGEMGENA